MRKVLLALVVLLAAACGASTPSASSSAPASPSSAATVALGTDSTLGKFLVDGGGRTLYLFAQDGSAESTCYGACAKYWPPLLTNGAPRAGDGVNEALLGTTKRNDGTVEVTYGGHPLYYVVTDHNPGDVTGQAVNNFGAPWYAVAPDGNRITAG